MQHGKIITQEAQNVMQYTYMHTYIFYFSNPEHTHQISTCKNNKRTLVLWLNEGHNAS